MALLLIDHQRNLNLNALSDVLHPILGPTITTPARMQVGAVERGAED